MTKHEVAFLACRILALWILTKVAMDLSILAISFIAMMSEILREGEFTSLAASMAILLGPVLALVMVGTLLWKKSGQVADRIFPKSEASEPIVASNLSAEELLSVAFGVTGMVVVVYTVPNFGRHLLTPQLQNLRLMDAWRDGQWQLELWMNILQFGLGIWLMVGMRGIARFIMSLKKRDLPDLGAPDEGKDINHQV